MEHDQYEEIPQDGGESSLRQPKYNKGRPLDEGTYGFTRSSGPVSRYPP